MPYQYPNDSHMTSSQVGGVVDVFLLECVVEFLLVAAVAGQSGVQFAAHLGRSVLQVNLFDFTTPTVAQGGG